MTTPSPRHWNKHELDQSPTVLSTLALAGGGNRCWWQAGVLSKLMQEGWQLPPQLIGTSAGAAIAASCLTTGPEAALDACKELYSRTSKIFEWRSLMRGRLQFAHQTVYPSWIRAFVNENTFASLRATGSSLHVAVTRPSQYLGLRVSITLGTLAYLIDKKIWHSFHPRLPHLIGLRQEFIDITQSSSAIEAIDLLTAAAAAPPIMAAVYIEGRYAFDGGYIDNAPIPDQTHTQRKSTFVMLTRHYPSLPMMFRFRDRLYCQPSRPVPVSTWDCTKKSTVDQAFELGRQDADALLSAGLIK
jgi:predicted acylesterase/phospholipase RssA